MAEASDSVALEDSEYIEDTLSPTENPRVQANFGTFQSENGNYNKRLPYLPDPNACPFFQAKWSQTACMLQSNMKPKHCSRQQQPANRASVIVIPK